MTIVQVVVQLLLQIVVAPVVLRFAGQNALGAFAAIVQCLAYMLAIDVGFYAMVVKYLAGAYGRGGVGPEFMTVVVTARRFFGWANIGYAILIAVFATNAGRWLNLPPAEAEQARSGLWWLAGWTLIRVPFLVASFALYSVQDLAARNGIAVAGSVLRFAVTLALVVAGFGLTGLIAGYIINDVVEHGGSWLRFRSVHPGASRFAARHDAALLRGMLKLSISTLLIVVGSRVLYFSDNLIVGMLVSAAAASVYYTTQLPATFGWLTINRLTENAAPAINEIHARAEPARLRSVYLKLHRYVFLVSLPFATGLLLFNEAVVSRWVGPGQFGGLALTAGLAVVSLGVTSGCVDYAFLLASGAVQRYALVFAAAAVLKCALSLWLCQRFGPVGVVFATAPAALMYVAYGQRSMRRRLAISQREFLARCLRPVLPAVALAAALVAPWVWYAPAGRWWELAGQVTVFLLVYAGMAWHGLLPEEHRAAREKWLTGWAAVRGRAERA